MVGLVISIIWVDSDSNLKMAILDACRNNPFARSFRSASRGLARMDAPHGTLLMYATRPGDVAADGEGKNGVFTEHFLASLDMPGLEAYDVFKRTASKVYTATNKQQTPYFEGFILGDFVFNERSIEKTSSLSETHQNSKPTPHVSSEDKDEKLWRYISKSNDFMEIISFIRNNPSSVYVPLARQRIALLSKSNIKSYEPDTIIIEGGTFNIGDSTYKPRKERLNNIKVEPYAIGKYEITKRQFMYFIEDSGYITSNNGCMPFQFQKERKIPKGESWKAPGFDQSEDHPVVCISWKDAKAYTKWLSKKTGKTYRLPSEAEWEFAAKSKSRTRYSFGDDENNLCSYGNGRDESFNKYSAKNEWDIVNCNDNAVFTSVVGMYKPNKYGLYDMHGNVEEWTCSRNFDFVKTNGGRECLDSPSRRYQMVSKGGSWHWGPDFLASNARGWSHQTNSDSATGFRVARSLK